MATRCCSRSRWGLREGKLRSTALSRKERLADNRLSLGFVCFGGWDSLLRPTHGLLKLVAAHFPFEAAVGQNGAVWVRANEVKHVIAVGKVLEAADQAKVSHESGEGEEEMQEEGLDAEYVLKNRASKLDAKKVRGIVQEFL